MAQARPDSTRPRISRPRHIMRDLALDGLLGVAVLATCVTGFAWLFLEMGGGRYALYAHLRAGSIKVKPGDRVKLGQVMAHVGNSGNTLAPHLHFHVMDAPVPLAANGLPYAIDAFTVTGTTGGTAAFDKAEADGTPVALTRETPPRAVKNALPLDQLEITFGR